MSKQTPRISVLTANRLGDGIVVFLDGLGVWVESAETAAVARSPEEACALESRGAKDAARNLVVDPYLVEMRELAGGGLEPVRFRERVRLAGPSIIDGRVERGAAAIHPIAAEAA
jgi:sulfite reductase (NADPH) hemoprotein beta-component